MAAQVIAKIYTDICSRTLSVSRGKQIYSRLYSSSGQIHYILRWHKPVRAHLLLFFVFLWGLCKHGASFPVSLNNMNLLSSKSVCPFKDKKIRDLTNLLVGHLCCEANSFLACATSVKPTAYYPIMTNLNNAYQFKSNLSIRTLYRLCNLNRIWFCHYSLYTLLRPLKMSCVLGRVSSFSPVCAINNRFILILSLLQFFFAGEEWVRSTQRQGAESMIDNSVMRLVSSDD